MTAIAWLNGTWQPPADARVSVLDRGFMFGDGVYEVIPVYGARPFALVRHLTRLSNSLGELKLANPMNDDAWSGIISEAIERSGEPVASAYLQVTRGVAARRDLVFPVDVKPTVLVMVYAVSSLSRTNLVPLRMITLDDYRWQRGHLKTISLVASGMLRNEALMRGADDAILLKDGLVTEATASNVFVAKAGVLVTPPKSNRMLHGITRDIVIELAKQQGLPIEEREITAAELADADEVMITSSGHEVYPVGMVDGRVVGNGQGGLMWQQLDRLFQACKASGLEG